MKSYRVFTIFFSIFLLFSFHSFVFGRGLECSYISDIQDRYLNLHINYSNFNRRSKNFKSKLKRLQRNVANQMIKVLDMEKMYFTTHDVASIKRWLKNIFSNLKKKDCSVFNKIYDLYYKRVSERVSFAKKYLKSFVLGPKIKLVLDPKKRKRAKTFAELNNFQKKYLQYQMANAIVASDEEEYVDQVDDAKRNLLRNYYDRLKKRIKSWDMSLSDEEKRKCFKRKDSFGKVTICKPHKWYSIYLDSFARALDAHSGYLSHEDHEDFEINMRLSLVGIGASLRSKYGHTIIEKLISGGAAKRSGKLKSQDKILAVGQSAEKMVNIFDMDLRDIVSMIRGKKGTKVFLKILRPKKGKTKKKKFIVRLIRDRVNLKDQAATIFYFDKKRGKKKYKIALITVPSFYGESHQGGRSVSNDVRKLLVEAKKKKVSSVVLDLSNNGGGSLTEAVQLAGLFFSSGNVVRRLLKTPTGGEHFFTLYDKDKSTEYSGPLIVLVSRVSASASEIVSGTLKSYKRAVIVGGDHTFGKGSIQSVEPLGKPLGSIRVTVGLFFIPDGFSTQLNGVSSDVTFPSMLSNEEIGEKTLDHVLPGKRIPSFLSKSVNISDKFNKWMPVTNNLIGFLKNRSLKRIEKDEKFAEIKKDFRKMQRRKKQGYLTSIAEIFDEAKKEDAKSEKEEKQEEKMADSDKALKKKYIERADVQEAINVAVDQASWEQRQEKKLAFKE